MGFPDRTRHGRTRLAVELLEDRTTPAKLDAVTLALPELVATGAVVGDRVNVVMTATSTNAADAANLAAAPFAANVTALGFGIYNVTLTPGTDLATAIAFYGRAAGVVSAEPDQIVQVQRTPNDPSYSSLYGMPKIGAPAAWDITTGNPNFVVGVIDSGVDYTHPDLYLNVWINQAEIPSAVRAQLTDTDGDTIISFRDLNNSVNIGPGKITDLNGNGRIDGGDLLRSAASGGWADGTDAGSNGFTDDLVGWDFANNDNNPLDDNNHGTHVAGTIGAIGDNSVGVAGVNWSVSIAGLKFLAANGSGSISAATAALNYAVNVGIKVSNNSWGGGGFSSAMSTAISLARDAGHIFVAAAGNSASNNDVTASYPSNYNFNNVVAVAATDQNDNLASFSSFGATTVDLAAPGVSILSTTPNNTYSSFSGTSMATPHVAGAIALYWGANPSLTYTQVIDKLKSSVDVIAGLNGKVATGGRLNVAKMFAGSPPTVPPPPVVAPGPKVTGATFNGAAVNGVTAQLSSVRVTFDKAINASTFTTADITGFTGPNGSIVPTGVSAVTTTQFDITFATQTTPGSYAITFGPDIRDTAGNPMNQNGDGANGQPNDQFTATGSLVRIHSNTTPLTIPDLRTVTSTINITSSGTISDLDAIVNLTHTWDSDLFITLRSPAGTTATLFNRRGGSGDNMSNTRFSDEASTAIGSGAAPFAGSFRPETALSAFDGQSTIGVWTLTIADRASGDSGRLNSWSLVVNSTAGGMSVSALGFRDEPAAAFDDTEPLADPIAVTAAEPASAATPAAPATAAPMEVNYGSAVGSPLAWLDSTADRRGYDAPTTTDTSTDRETLPAFGDEPRGDATDPFAAVYATLYLAPDISADAGDVFEAFAIG